jgi:hypothetical protein
MILAAEKFVVDLEGERGELLNACSNARKERSMSEA